MHMHPVHPPWVRPWGGTANHVLSAQYWSDDEIYYMPFYYVDSFSLGTNLFCFQPKALRGASPVGGRGS
jgi:hypothetical protein